MVSDRVTDCKMANIAASLVAAAASANGSIDEKERELNEVITGLQILREELLRRVSRFYLNFYFEIPSIQKMSIKKECKLLNVNHSKIYYTYIYCKTKAKSQISVEFA